MPTKKIADLPKTCRHPEHDPPSHMVYQPGIYEHTCPGCGRSFQFTVRGPTWTDGAVLDQRVFPPPVYENIS